MIPDAPWSTHAMKPCERVSAAGAEISIDQQPLSGVQVSATGVVVPAIVSRALSAAFDTAVSLAGLPFDVQVDGVDVTGAGVVLHLSGQGLVYYRN